jgi:tRNA A-37 threonylcarbamoyl transferase component Bud32
MGASLPDPLDQLRTALGDRYVLGRELGGGAMSRVFVAKETGLGRSVVIKVLPPDLGVSLSLDRFRREIHLAASLQHPHIVPLLSAGQAGELLYYTMPLVEGESLRARLRRDGELPVPEATRILRDVADALSYAHRHGVIHRDIKPDNVLLSEGHALVTDFGVAKALDEARESSLTSTGLALGTPAYMAPEQAAADPHTDHRADLYALGVLGYEILAGQPPFTAPTAQAVVAAHMLQTPVPLSELRPSVPGALAALVMRCLAKRPADRPQSAAEVLHQLEGAGATTPVNSVELATAPHPTAPRTVAPARRPWLAPAAIGVAVAAALAAWLMLRQSRHAATLDADLVAVAPFDVPDTRLALWREGLVDVLSRNLDGAGPLRSVPPTTVIRRWSGRADRPSAVALGRSTGAQVVVIGSLIGAGPDSARVTATALDATDGRILADLELRDAADRVDRLADSLTVRLLRELGRTRRIEVFRTASLGSTTLPALKAFLRGEQWFRRASWDSAMVAYDEAIRLDSTFALPLWRSGQVLGWAHVAGDSVSVARAIRAGALAHRLAPRDSLLLTADSILAMLYRDIPRVSPAAIRRVFVIAEDLTRRYPDDAESWYLLGEARYHWGVAAEHTPREALDAFDHAIRLDSALAPAYIHAVELALSLDGPEAAHRYAKGYLDLGSGNTSSDGIRLADQLMARRGAPRVNVDSLLRAASPSALRDARLALEEAADSGEAAVALARALAAAPPGDAAWLGPNERELSYGVELLNRGHVREAAKIIFRNPSALPLYLTEAALVSSSLPDGADRRLHGLLDGSRLMALSTTLPWWAARGDSVTVRGVARTADSLARSATTEVNRGIARYAALAAPAYLALIRRDTAAAVRTLEALPDSLCAMCYMQRMTLGHLLAARKEDEKAAKLLDRWLIDIPLPSTVLWTLDRARVAERLGEREKAIRSYQYVADVWRRADPELQPYVAEAKEGLSRLTSEER